MQALTQKYDVAPTSTVAYTALFQNIFDSRDPVNLEDHGEYFWKLAWTWSCCRERLKQRRAIRNWAAPNLGPWPRTHTVLRQPITTVRPKFKVRPRVNFCRLRNPFSLGFKLPPYMSQTFYDDQLQDRLAQLEYANLIHAMQPLTYAFLVWSWRVGMNFCANCLSWYKLLSRTWYLYLRAAISKTMILKHFWKDSTSPRSALTFLP